MKNNPKICLSAILIMALLLGGCSGQKETDEATENATQQSETTVATTEPDTGVYISESDEEGISAEDMQENTATVEPENGATEETVKPTDKQNSDKKDTTQSSTETTKPNDAEQETKPDNATEGPEPVETEPEGPSGPCCEYGAYLNMSGHEQQAYMESFGSPVDFVNWLQEADAEHNAHSAGNVIEGGKLDIRDFVD